MLKGFFQRKIKLKQSIGNHYENNVCGFTNYCIAFQPVIKNLLLGLLSLSYKT